VKHFSVFAFAWRQRT